MLLVTLCQALPPSLTYCTLLLGHINQQEGWKEISFILNSSHFLSFDIDYLMGEQIL